MLHRALPSLYLFLVSALILWDLVMAGRIVQLRRSHPDPWFTVFTGITAFAGLLLLPGLLVAVFGGSMLWGRAIQSITWLWPITALLFTLQALVSVRKQLTTSILGLTVVVYNAFVAAVAWSHHLASQGSGVPDWLLILSAAQASALGLVGGVSALQHAAWIAVPAIAPALPSRWKIGSVARAMLEAALLGSLLLILIQLPSAMRAIGGYRTLGRAHLEERQEGTMAIGLKVFPELRGEPPPPALRSDLDLIARLNPDAIEIVVDPDAAHGAALDSVARSVERIRNDSTTLIVALGYPRLAAERMLRDRRGYLNARLADVNRLTRRLHPNIILPAVEPYGLGAQRLGTQPLSFWIEYVSRAAELVRNINPNVKVGIGIAGFGARDSALYAWAAAAQSPVNVVGFSLFPGFRGARNLTADMATADRWMQRMGVAKSTWVLSTGGYPVIHGEQSQALAVWSVLCWASARPNIRGVIVAEPGDYQTQMGIRAADGHLRPVAETIGRAEKER